MKRIAAAVAVVLAILLGARVARADTFASGSLIIPMDTTYQDNGMLKAYGLIYNLLSHGVPIRWVINPAKAYQGTDFTASATDLKTNAVITAHGYRGGPFVIDSADAAAAKPFITAWWTAHPMPLVTVHSVTASFSGSVAKYMIAAPRVAMHADGNQQIAIGYLNAASIPDSQGNAWPNTSPDLLTPAQVAGPTTTNHHDGALFDSNGVPLYCQFMSMHWDVNAAAMSPETVWEVRSFLGHPVHFYAECQAVDAFENTVVPGQNGLPGHFLTTGGLVFGPQPNAVDYYNPTQTFAQIDGTFGPVGGSEPSYALAPGSAYKAGGVQMLTGHGVAPGAGQDVWMTGYLDGACPPNSDACGPIGKVSYLGGHQYQTNTPISTNPQTQGVRLFLNSLFDSVCASQNGFPTINVIKLAPASTTSSTVVYSVSYSNAGPTAALNAVLTDPLPAGAAFVSATNGGTFAAGKVTWNLGNLGAGQGGNVSVTVTLASFGTYANTATLAFKVGLNGFTQPSNVATTLYAACIGDWDCPAAKPVCDPGTNTCRACQGSADCVGMALPVCDGLAGSPNLGACVDCVSDADCMAPDARCNLPTNTCVQCLAAADCGGVMPTCNLVTHTCKQCSTDAECSGATPACEPWGACGQCSSTNKTQCASAAKLCDTPTGTCVACETNADCSGSMPVCQVQTHTCQPCTVNSECATNPGAPACATSGMKAGACVPCTGDGFCSGATPKCDTVSNVCVGCLTSADCSVASPACSPVTKTCVGCVSDVDCPGAQPICSPATMTCGGCSGDYTQPPGPSSCPLPQLPACQPAGGALAGACTQCSMTNATVCAANAGTPVCVVASAICGCILDSDCAKGNYCDVGQVSTGFCQPGCEVVNNMDNCPSGQTCSVQSGMVGVCQASSSSSSSSSSSGASSSSSTGSTSSSSSSGAGGASTSSSSGAGGASSSSSSGVGGMSTSSSGATGSSSGGGAAASSSSGGLGGAGHGGAGHGGAGTGANTNEPGKSGSCACRTAPAETPPVPALALLGLAGMAWRRRARPGRASTRLPAG